MYYAGLGAKKKAASTVADAAKKVKEDLLQAEQHLQQQQYGKIPNWAWYIGAGVGALILIRLLRK